MRLPGSSSLVLVLLGEAAAVALQPRVFVQDPDTPVYLGARATPILSPEIAHLVFAQRLGLSQSYTLDNANDESIRYINRFSGMRHRLLDDERRDDDIKHVMVVVEDIKDTIVLDSTSFLLPVDSGANATASLLELFAMQPHGLASNSRAWNMTGLPIRLQDILTKMPKTTKRRISNGLVLAHIRGSGSSNNDDDDHDNDDYSSAIRELAGVCSSRWPLTVVVMPPSPSGHIKRTDDRRGEYNASAAERQQVETIITGVSTGDFVQRLTQIDPAASPTGSSNTTIRGILPACFVSKDVCESTTNRCSGRGSCVKKYADKDNNNKACYACQCKAQIRTNRDGSKKTTYYGGPACQKKDVVMPFWLFTGFAIGMSFMLSYGIGILYSMGNEELPSVIGAGVSGPSARH